MSVSNQYHLRWWGVEAGCSEQFIEHSQRTFFWGPLSHSLAITVNSQKLGGKMSLPLGLASQSGHKTGAETITIQ